MSLQRFCQKPVVKIAPGNNIIEACSMMATKNVGCLVVENEEKLCGILTDRDIALKVTGAQKDPQVTRIIDVMTCDPIRVSVDKEVNHVTSLMHAYHVRRVPIVDGAGTTLGIITLDDLIALLGHELSEIGKAIAEGFSQEIK
jgi:CBS domain-containing protein